MMENGAQYRQATYTLQPGEGIDYAAYGNTFGCLEATDEFFVSFDGNPRTKFNKGITFKAPEPFKSVRIENRGATANEITIVSATGDMYDARLVLPADLTAFTGAARTLVSSTAEIDSGERLEIVAANTDQLEVIVTNMGTEPVFLGDANVAWKRGLPLDAGSTATLKIQSALYAYAQASGTQTLSILETRK